MTNKNEVQDLITEFQENNPETHIFQRKMIKTFSTEELEKKPKVHITSSISKFDMGAGEMFLFTEEVIGENTICTGIEISGTLETRIWILDLNSKFFNSQFDFYEEVWKTNIREIFSIE